MSATDSETELRLVATVGVPLGTDVRRAAATEELHGLVRQGRDLLFVDVETYQLLVRAGSPVSLEHLLGWLDARGVADGAARVQHLLSEGLLTQFRLGDANPAFMNLRLQPLGLGLGRQKGQETYRIRLRDENVIEVDRLAFLIWAASDGSSLADVLQRLSREMGVDADEMGTLAAASTFALLLRGVAVLDRVP